MAHPVDDIMQRIWQDKPAWFPYGLSRSQLDQTWLIRDPATKAAAGFAGWQFRPSRSGKTTGWYAIGLLPEFRGKGLGSRALSELLGSKPAWVDDVKAFIVKGNTPSMRLAEKFKIPYQHKSASVRLPKPERAVSLLAMIKSARPSIVNLQQYMPLVSRRTRFTPQEQASIEQNQRNWFPALFTSAADSPAADMHSPEKAALMAGLLGGGAGVFGANVLNASPQTSVLTGLGGGLLSSLAAYLHTKAHNSSVEESMRRIPPNGTRRDVESDPVYQAGLDRAAQSGASAEALRTAQMLAALNAVKHAGVGAALKSFGKGTGRTLRFAAPGAAIATGMDLLNENESPFWSAEHPHRMKNWLMNTLLLTGARGGARVAAGGGAPWKAQPNGALPGQLASEFAALAGGTPLLYGKDFLRTNMDIGTRLTSALNELKPVAGAPAENWLQTAGKVVADNPWTSALLAAGGVGALGLALKNQGRSEFNLVQEPAGGRIRVTLPTKKPGDMETALDMPLDQMPLSGALKAKLRRDALRRLRKETDERTVRRSLPPAEAQRRAEFMRSLHA